MSISNPFQGLMLNLYLTSLKSSNLKKVLEYLSDTTIDYRENDNQFLRELRVGRLNIYDTLLIYKTLIQKRNYIMTSNDLDKLIHSCLNRYITNRS